MNFVFLFSSPIRFLRLRKQRPRTAQDKGTGKTGNNPLIEELFAQSFRRLYQIRHQSALRLPGHDFAELFLQVRGRLVRVEMPPLASAPVVPDHHVTRPQFRVAVLVHPAAVPTGLGIVHVSEEGKRAIKVSQMERE